MEVLKICIFPNVQTSVSNYGPLASETVVLHFIESVAQIRPTPVMNGKFS